jgi:flagellar hook-associated protein 1 FlgK
LGVRVSGITRNVSAFSQSEVRRTTSDAARADTGRWVDQSVRHGGQFQRLYRHHEFQSALSQMTSSPANLPLRANVVEAARTMAQSFNRPMPGCNRRRVHRAKHPPGSVNLTIWPQAWPRSTRPFPATRTLPTTAGLLDQRDTILQQMSALTNINTTFNDDNTVTVTLPGSQASTLVDHGTANSLSMNTGTDGNISFAVGANAFTPTGGSLAGQQQVISAGVTAKANLDTIANSMMTTINDAQANGVDLTGATGSAMFSGTGAANMAMVLTSPNQLAAASAGSSASSQNGTNLNAMIGALDSANVSGQMNNISLACPARLPATRPRAMRSTPLPAMPRHRWLRHRASISIPRRRL